MEKVLVVGTGITGAVTASFLRKSLPKSCSVSMWDKSRGSGWNIRPTVYVFYVRESSSVRKGHSFLLLLFLTCQHGIHYNEECANVQIKVTKSSVKFK